MGCLRPKMRLEEWLCDRGRAPDGGTRRERVWQTLQYIYICIYTYYSIFPKKERQTQHAMRTCLTQSDLLAWAQQEPGKRHQKKKGTGNSCFCKQTRHSVTTTTAQSHLHCPVPGLHTHTTTHPRPQVYSDWRCHVVRPF